jgi:CubicO group peptidase (beta-lactamase class C family)
MVYGGRRVSRHACHCLSLAFAVFLVSPVWADTTPFHSTSRFVVTNPELPETAMRLGEVVTGEVNGPEVDRFTIDLKAGEYAGVRVNQLGGDLSFAIFDADGKMLELVDTNQKNESEVGTFTAEKAGRYAIQVAQYDYRPAATAYSIQLLRKEPLAKSAAAQAEQMLTTWYDGKNPGIAVLIAKDGKPVIKRTIGLASVEDGVPIRPSTKFELASVSKQFTGYAIAMLIERGIVSRDDDVRKWLPNVPDFGHPITVGHLLDHSSGLRDWDAAFGLAGLRVEGGISTRQVMDFVARQKSLNFVPGSQLQYSNTGYVLLGEIITKATGKPAGQWMQENMFAPLGMKDTVFNQDYNAIISNKAVAYKGRDKLAKLLSGNSSGIGGSTSVLSSLDDLEKWAANLDSPKLGGPRLKSLLGSFGKLNDGTPVNYSFGNWHVEKMGVPVISHLGLAGGFRTKLSRYPEQKIDVVFLSNDGDDATYGRAGKLEKLFLPFKDSPVEVPIDEPPAPQPDKLAPKLSDYVGTYYSDELRTAYELRLERDQLVATHALNDEIIFKHSDADNFSTGQWYMPVIAFGRDDKGAVVTMTVSTEGARNMVFRRLAM